MEAYSGAELTLETTGYQLYLTFSNFSDARLESGASVDREGKLLFDAGLTALLDGQWYWVPHKEYDTAGVGLEAEPGDTVQGPGISVALWKTARRTVPDHLRLLAQEFRRPPSRTGLL